MTVIMSAARFTVSVEDRLMQKLDRLLEAKVFNSRSHAVQVAVGKKISRMERSRLAEECAKLDPAEEVAMAEVRYAGG